MKTGISIKWVGFVSLIGWGLTSITWADAEWRGGTLTYSPDRWPSRWSSVVRQAPRDDDRAYGYGYRDRRDRQDNPWAHDSSMLFDVPEATRPWGEPPRKSRRQQERARSYREQARPEYRRNPGYEQYPAYGLNPYAGMAAPVYPGLGFGYAPPVVAPGLTYPYGVSPLLTPTVPGAYPYGVYPGRPGGLNWPMGAW